ncbi:MAG TPA: TonB family protein [Rhodothermales bacterium]|nr:TonB family protein [Rhodothermales bacterium]
MSGARNGRDVDIDADVNIDPERELQGPHPYFTWHEERYVERLRRTLHSGKTSFGLGVGTSLLTLLLLVQPYWRFGRYTATWSGSNQVAYAATLKTVELPALERATDETEHTPGTRPQRRDGRNPPASTVREQSRMKHEAHKTPPEQLAGGAARMEGGNPEGLAPGLLQAAARSRERARPRPLLPDTTAPLFATAEMLVPAPDLAGAEALDRPPQLDARSLHIDYPTEAKKKQIQGSVILHFYVDSDGRTSSIQVLKSLHPSCDGAAIAALYAARFTPGEEHGHPVGTFTRLIVRFVLQ